MVNKIQGHPEQLPLDTLDLTELLVQWKVMKGLGYKSLFDPDFRRELRNPVRRILYYRIVMEEEARDREFFINVMKGSTDRIAFFSDPTLFRKVKETEDREEMKDPAIMQEKVQKARENIRRVPSASEADKQVAIEFLKRT